MSANLVVDLANTVQAGASIGAANIGTNPSSGITVGMVVDMLNANVHTNLFAAAGPSISGQFKVLVQTSDATTSGSFTDPTSGLAGLPGGLLSGGVAVFNSGNTQFNSGGLGFASFQRPHRYARAIIMSGDLFDSPVTVGFIGGLKTTGSGGGYSLSPTSGGVNV